jgi:hypothetical protein
VRHFEFPKRITVQLCTPDAHANWRPAAVRNFAISTRVFARAKNDYDLGPFFSDASGRVIMTEVALRALAAGELESGLMDYYDIVTGSFPLVEITAWSGDRVSRAIEARKLWGVLSAERAIWPTKEALLDALGHASNSSFQINETVGYSSIRDEWDNPMLERNYELRIFPR